MGVLYKLTFSSGKSYVGITCRSAKARYKNHAQDAGNDKSKCLVHQAWRRFGAPKMEVLAVVEDRSLLETEHRAVDVFGTLAPGGYNMIEGGGASPSIYPSVRAKISASKKGYSHPPEVIERIAAKNRGMIAWNKGQKGVVKPKMTRKQKAARCEKMWATRRERGNGTWAGTGKGGYAWTEEQKAAKSKAMRKHLSDPKILKKQTERVRVFCKQHPDFGLRLSAAGANAKRGTVTPASTRALMSASKMGHEVTKSARQKISEALKGRPLSDEHRATVSAAMKKSWERRKEAAQSLLVNTI